MKFTSHFEPKEKLSDTTTRMAKVTVRTLDGKIIGEHCWSRQPNENQIQQIIDELIREYGERKHFNSGEWK